MSAPNPSAELYDYSLDILERIKAEVKNPEGRTGLYSAYLEFIQPLLDE